MTENDPSTVRVLVTIDIPRGQVTDLLDLRSAVTARLCDEAGYDEDGNPYTPVRVAVDVVNDQTDLSTVPGGLRHIYETGIKSVRRWGDKWRGEPVDAVAELVRHLLHDTVTARLAPGRTALQSGDYVKGVSTGPGYSTEWAGIYVGVREDEGAPYHSFKDGHVGDVAQTNFGFPSDQFRVQVHQPGPVHPDAPGDR